MDHVRSADGTEIAVERVGTGQPLVFLHGTGGSRGSFRAVADELAHSRECLLVDRRGRGASGDADDHSLEREVEDALAVLDHVDGPVTLFGHSFGGIVSLEVARRTDRLDRLVLYEPPVVDDESFSLDALRDAYETGGDRGALRSFWKQAIGEEHPQGWDEWVEDTPPGRTFVRESAAVAEYDLPETVDAGAPTLSLVGNDSKPSIRESGVVAHEAIPESRLVELDGHGHGAMAAAPDLVAAKVESFLDA